MHSLIGKYQLKGQFRWIAAQIDEGQKGELYGCIADTRGAFVQPVLYEGFGLTVIEALNSGLPTFATNQGGPSEMIVVGVSGFLIDPNKATRSLISLGNAKSILNIGIASRLLVFHPVYSHFTWKIYAMNLLNMGSGYGVWRHMNKEQKLAKTRYIQMLYNLQFRNLGGRFPRKTACLNQKGSSAMPLELVVSRDDIHFTLMLCPVEALPFLRLTSGTYAGHLKPYQDCTQ